MITGLNYYNVHIVYDAVIRINRRRFITYLREEDAKGF